MCGLHTFAFAVCVCVFVCSNQTYTITTHSGYYMYHPYFTRFRRFDNNTNNITYNFQITRIQNAMHISLKVMKSSHIANYRILLKLNNPSWVDPIEVHLCSHFIPCVNTSCLVTRAKPIHVKFTKLPVGNYRKGNM